MNLWNIFFSAFGGTATALVVAGACFKYLIEHRLARHIESFKQTLQLELVKGSLFYTKRHEKSAEIFGQISSLIRALATYLYAMVDHASYAEIPPPDVEKKAKETAEKVNTKLNDLLAHTLANSLYFNDDVTEAVYKLHYDAYTISVISKNLTHRNIAEQRKKADDSLHALFDAQKAIEKKFKELIGVDE